MFKNIVDPFWSFSPRTFAGSPALSNIFLKYSNNTAVSDFNIAVNKFVFCVTSTGLRLTRSITVNYLTLYIQELKLCFPS
jgi:hypothetical protein